MQIIAFFVVGIVFVMGKTEVMEGVAIVKKEIEPRNRSYCPPRYATPLERRTSRSDLPTSRQRNLGMVHLLHTSEWQCRRLDDI